ncbi:MAG: glycosyltransferase [Patescibacteria group bacterium]|nr:glycosyltransferase [Patescibacteria group bacterium]
MTPETCNYHPDLDPLTAERELASSTERLKELRIAQIHFYTEQADGVSLQTQETRSELKRRGASVFTISADFDPNQDTHQGAQIAELGYHRSDVSQLRREMNPALNRQSEDGGSGPSVLLPGRESELMDAIYKQAYVIEKKLEAAFDKHRINVLHVRNISSLPHLHPAAALAMYRLIERHQNIHFVLHHHDLSWEGPAAEFNYYAYPKIEQLMQELHAPNFANTSHIAINPDTKYALEEKYGIDVEYIPDGFNFDQEIKPVKRARLAEVANENLSDGETQVKPNDLLLGMMTRVVSNKAIEVAIQLAANLQNNRSWMRNQKIGPHQIQFSQDSQIILILPNLADAQADYKQKLIKHAQQRNVRLIFIENLDDHGIHFYQTYDALDAIVYPSEHEGFGNQGVEAVWALKILVVHHYPVFKALADHIPHHVPLGTNADMVESSLSDGLHLLDQWVLDRATVELIKALLDSETDSKLLENRKLLRRLCSISKVVRQYIEIYLKYPLDYI